MLENTNWINEESAAELQNVETILEKYSAKYNGFSGLSNQLNQIYDSSKNKKHIIEEIENNYLPNSRMAINCFNLYKQNNPLEFSIEQEKINILKKWIIENDLLPNSGTALIFFKLYKLNNPLEFSIEQEKINFLENWLVEKKALSNISNKENEVDNETVTLDTKKHKPIEANFWFKVALLFANGEMATLLKNHSQNCTEVAKKIDPVKWKSYRPYISSSIGAESQGGNKNIFSSEKKIKQIQEYCNKNNVIMIESFSKLFQTK